MRKDILGIDIVSFVENFRLPQSWFLRGSNSMSLAIKKLKCGYGAICFRVFTNL